MASPGDPKSAGTASRRTGNHPLPARNTRGVALVIGLAVVFFILLALIVIKSDGGWEIVVGQNTDIVETPHDARRSLGP